MKLTSFRLLLVAATAFFTLSAAAKLSIGDPAPALQTGKWVQGDAVTGFDTNHVYIVEFWATWCGPCRASIPHLNEVWQKFKGKGVIAIGQDIWEEDESGVPAFVKSMGTNMTYRVALDDKTKDPKGAMATTWMTAADQDGIPTAFIVNKHGRIAWMGHPMALEESTLSEIISDKFDVAAFAKQYQETREKEAAAGQQRAALIKQFNEAASKKDWKAAGAALDQVDATFPELRPRTAMIRIQMLLDQTNLAGAYRLAQSLGAADPTNAPLLNALAWTLATRPGIDTNGYRIAQTFAESANRITGQKEPTVLDTLARTQFINGKTNEAIATEQKAASLAPAALQDIFKRNVAAYQAGQLPDSEK